MAAAQSNEVYPTPPALVRLVNSRGASDKRFPLGLTKRPRCYHQRMIDWSSCPAAERDPARMSGAWVFKGTRVPIAALFENLEDDASVQQFVEWFPGVSLDQARAVLEHAAKSSLAVA